MSVFVKTDFDALAAYRKRHEAILSAEIERAFKYGFDAGFQAARPTDRDEMKAFRWAQYLKPWFNDAPDTIMEDLDEIRKVAGEPSE